MSAETKEEDLEKSSDSMSADFDWGRSPGAGEKDLEINVLEPGLPTGWDQERRRTGRKTQDVV